MDPNQTHPDELMTHFRGRSLKSIVIFTLVLHFVVIVGSSIPWLISTVSGRNNANLSEEERLQLAVKEATSALRKIAEDHQLQAQQLGDRLKGAAAPAGATDGGQETPTPSDPGTPGTTAPESAPTPPETPVQPSPDGTTAPQGPKSEIEKTIETVKPGPTKPPIDEAEDLFK